MKRSLQTWAPAALVCLLAVAVFANSFPGAFILDDTAIVRDNPLVEKPDLGVIFSTDYWGSWSGSRMYRPLTILSFAANRALFGPGVLSFHVVNVLLHAAASLLLYLLLRRLPLRDGVAWLAAALFTVHPVHAEAVNTVVGRGELLTAAFVFLGLLAATGRSGWHTPLTALWYCLALLAKESALAFVPILVCLDSFAAANLRETFRKRLRLYALLIAVSLLWLALRTWALGQSNVPPQIVSPSDNPVIGLTPLPRLLTAAWIQLIYLRNLLLPHPLLGVYTANFIGSVERVFSLRAAGVVVMTALLALLGVRGWLDRRGYGLGAALYLAAFVVNLNVVLYTYVAVADRLVYLPSAGFCLAAASIFLLPSGPGHPRPLRLGSYAAAGACLALLAGLTIAGNPRFSSPMRLWQQTVEADPRNSRAWTYLAGELVIAGRQRDAEDAYRRAIAADRSFPDPHIFFSSFLLDAGRPEEAIRHAEEAIRLEPGGIGPVFITAARANLRLGRPREALRLLDTVHRYYTTTPSYQEIRAKVLDALGEVPGAIEMYRKVAAFEGVDPAVPVRLAELLIGLGQAREAEEALRAPIAAGGNADVHNILGVSLALQGRFAEAAREFERALALEPGSTLFRENLENARAQAAGQPPGPAGEPPGGER